MAILPRDTPQRLHNDAGLMPLHIASGGGDAPPNTAVCEKLLKAAKPAGLVNAVSLRKVCTSYFLLPISYTLAHSY